MTKLLTPKEVAERVGDITPDTARKWMQSGKLPGAWPHGTTYIIEEAALAKAIKDGLEKHSHAHPTNGSPWLTSEQALAVLRANGFEMVHVTVLDWLRKGILPGQKVGRAWAVPREELARMLREGFEVPSPGRPPKE